MSKIYRPWNPEQCLLLPASLQEWLPADHLAYFILDVVRELDLSAIEAVQQEKDGRGERPYLPAMLVALLLYGYCTGRFSSRALARGTWDDVALRILAAGEHPHWTTINAFRLEHRAALGQLFVQGLRMCGRAGLVELVQVALDGSKIQANASKHKAMSYKRMGEEERRLAAEVQIMLDRGEAVDRQEDALYGPEGDGGSVPAELARREIRLARIREAKAELEREAAAGRAESLRELAEGQQQKSETEGLPGSERKQAATRAVKSRQQAEELEQRARDGQGRLPLQEEQDGEAGLPHHRPPATPSGEPKSAAQRNFTDPASRIMRRDGTYLQGYNVQIAVDGKAQVIVAEALTNQPPDQSHLVPLLERLARHLRRLPDVLLADAGYFSAANARYAEAHVPMPLLAVGREHGRGESVGQGREGSAERSRMRERLRTPEGSALYRRRKAIVEPVFGQIREAQGFHRFRLRGLSKVRQEWRLVCLAHNLRKLYRHHWLPRRPVQPCFTPS